MLPLGHQGIRPGKNKNKNCIFDTKKQAKQLHSALPFVVPVPTSIIKAVGGVEWLLFSEAILFVVLYRYLVPYRACIDYLSFSDSLAGRRRSVCYTQSHFLVRQNLGDC